LDSVREFSDKVKGLGYPIDALLCNAGVSSPVGTTIDGMALLLLPSLTKDGRTILISSDIHFLLFGTLPWVGAEKLTYPD